MEPAALYGCRSAEVLPGAVQQPDGRHGLTERELEVLTMVCQALPDKLIARRLDVSAKTVSTHLEHVYLKLGIRGDIQNARCAAILFAIESGIVAPHLERARG